MATRRLVLLLPATILTTLSLSAIVGCGGGDTPLPPAGPTPAPSPTLVTASAYILPDAVSKAHFAFGDKPVVIHPGERLRWVNADTITHNIVADSPDATDFRKTDDLPSAGEQSFIMNKPGTTRIHCAIHPTMTGTLIVSER